MKKLTSLLIGFVLVLTALCFTACGETLSSYSNIWHPTIKIAFIEGTTLADVPLGAGFTWANPETTVTEGSATYQAVFNTDPTNYLNFDLSITINAVYSDEYLAFSGENGRYNTDIENILDGVRLNMLIDPGDDAGYSAALLIRDEKHNVSFNAASNMQDGDWFVFIVSTGHSPSTPHGTHHQDFQFGIAKEDGKLYVNNMDGNGGLYWMQRDFNHIITGREIQNFNEISFEFTNDYSGLLVEIGGETFIASVNPGATGLYYLWLAETTVSVDLTNLAIV